MNPKNTYKIIIENAKKRDPNIKGAWHHIKPRCMGGSDNPRNLVKLTYKEHFFCHYLLTKIYPKNGKLRLAYYFMANVSGTMISAKHYQESMEIAMKYLSKTSKKAGKERWENPEKCYKIGKKKVTYREYITWKASKADHSYMKDKQFQLSCNQSKCLKYMWRYLSENNITNLTDDIIKQGWKSRKLKQSTNTWKKFFKSFKHWKFELLNYIKENPIDVNFSYKHKEPNKKDVENRQKTRMIHDFERIWKENRFVNNDPFLAKYYYKKGRCYRILNWRKYFSKKEWTEIVHKIIDNQ